MLQKNPSLMASFTNTPLCSEAFSAHAARPQVWGDILVHLNCHESDILTWAAVLEVIRWHCDLCFDRVGATPVRAGAAVADTRITNAPRGAGSGDVVTDESQ